MPHVLLLEPDTVLAAIYRRALEQGGHRVTWSVSAQNAINTIDQDCPDIVVLELQLANHNGIEFLYELRSYADWQNLPVIIHSLIRPLPNKTWADLGVAAYLYKPQTPLASMVQTIDRVLHATMNV